MVLSEIRANARKSLTGKWGKAALLTLIYSVLFTVIAFVLNLIPIIGQLAFFVIATPISFGLIVSYMKLKRGEDIGYVDFFKFGFSSFAKVWAVFGNMLLKMIVPICLIIVFIILIAVGAGGAVTSGIISGSTSGVAGFGILTIIASIGYIASLIYATVKGYLYILSYFILNDNPDMSGKEIVEKSASLMRGNRWKFFLLGLTFIGWAILASFTFGIGMLWLMPYIMIAFICFYEELDGKATGTETKNTEVDPIKVEE